MTSSLILLILFAAPLAAQPTHLSPLGTGPALPPTFFRAIAHVAACRALLGCLGSLSHLGKLFPRVIVVCIFLWMVQGADAAGSAGNSGIDPIVPLLSIGAAAAAAAAQQTQAQHARVERLVDYTSEEDEDEDEDENEDEDTDKNHDDIFVPETGTINPLVDVFLNEVKDQYKDNKDTSNPSAVILNFVRSDVKSEMLDHAIQCMKGFKRTKRIKSTFWDMVETVLNNSAVTTDEELYKQLVISLKGMKYGFPEPIAFSLLSVFHSLMEHPTSDAQTNDAALVVVRSSEATKTKNGTKKNTLFVNQFSSLRQELSKKVAAKTPIGMIGVVKEIGSTGNGTNSDRRSPLQKLFIECVCFRPPKKCIIRKVYLALFPHRPAKTEAAMLDLLESCFNRRHVTLFVARMRFNEDTRLFENEDDGTTVLEDYYENQGVQDRFWKNVKWVQKIWEKTCEANRQTASLNKVVRDMDRSTLINQTPTKQSAELSKYIARYNSLCNQTVNVVIVTNIGNIDIGDRTLREARSNNPSFWWLQIMLKWSDLRDSYPTLLSIFPESTYTTGVVFNTMYKDENEKDTMISIENGSVRLPKCCFVRTDKKRGKKRRRKTADAMDVEAATGGSGAAMELDEAATAMEP